jgi:uncharacterized protein YdbL (DUF1318 family)
MLSNPRAKLPFFVLGFFLASCAQFNIYVTFPATEIQKAAEKIEEEVRQAKPSDNPSDKLDKPHSFRRYYFLPTFDLQSAMAETTVDLTVTTPGIRKMIDSRKARYPELKPYLDKGIIGEGSDGMVVVRSLSGLSGADKVQVTRLVQAENGDRKELIREFARANNIDPKATASITKPFAEAAREKMETGHWYQDDAGNWKQK